MTETEQTLFDIETKADLILKLQKLGYDGIDLLYWSKEALINELMNIK